MKNIFHKIFIIICFVLLFQFNFLYGDDISPNELLVIIGQIEDRVNELQELNSDRKIQQIIDELKDIIFDYQYKGKDIEDVNDIIVEKIGDLEDRINKLRFLNVDDEMSITLRYLKNRLSKLDKKLTDDEVKEMIREKKTLKQKRDDYGDEGSKSIIEYLVEKVTKLEQRIEYLQEQGADAEKLKKIEELEEKMDELLTGEKKEEIMKMIKEIEDKDKQIQFELQKKVDMLMEDRRAEKAKLERPIADEQWGKQFAFQLNLAMTGIYTTISAGVMFPKIKNIVAIGTLFNLHVATPGTWVSDLNRAMALDGSLFVTFNSPVFINFIRIYAGGDFHFGSTFSATIVDHFGSNFTFGVFGMGGMEFYLLRQLAFFIEAGAGIMYMIGDETVSQVSQNNNNGTGIKLNFGMRIYVATKKKAGGVYKPKREVEIETEFE